MGRGRARGERKRAAEIRRERIGANRDLSTVRVRRSADGGTSPSKVSRVGGTAAVKIVVI